MGCSQCTHTKGGPGNRKRKDNKNNSKNNEINNIVDKKGETKNPNEKKQSAIFNNDNNNKEIGKNINNTTIEKTAIKKSNLQESEKGQKQLTYKETQKIIFQPNEIKKILKEKELDDNNKDNKKDKKDTQILFGETVVNTIINNNNITNIFNIIPNPKQDYNGTDTLVRSSSQAINLVSQHNLGNYSKYTTKIEQSKKSSSNINNFLVKESNNQNVCDNDIQGIINNQN